MHNLRFFNKVDRRLAIRILVSLFLWVLITCADLYAATPQKWSLNLALDTPVWLSISGQHRAEGFIETNLTVTLIIR